MHHRHKVPTSPISLILLRLHNFPVLNIDNTHVCIILLKCCHPIVDWTSTYSRTSVRQYTIIVYILDANAARSVPIWPQGTVVVVVVVAVLLQCNSCTTSHYTIEHLFNPSYTLCVRRDALCKYTRPHLIQIPAPPSQSTIPQKYFSFKTST